MKDDIFLASSRFIYNLICIFIVCITEAFLCSGAGGLQARLAPPRGQGQAGAWGPEVWGSGSAPGERLLEWPRAGAGAPGRGSRLQGPPRIHGRGGLLTRPSRPWACFPRRRRADRSGWRIEVTGPLEEGTRVEGVIGVMCVTTCPQQSCRHPALLGGSCLRGNSPMAAARWPEGVRPDLCRLSGPLGGPLGPQLTGAWGAGPAHVR